MPREPRRDALYLADIVEAARTVARWLQDRSEHWDQDEILRNAVLRQLMVIGEAAACLSDETRDELPDVPWHEVRGFRNQAVNAYFGLDWLIVWEIASVDLPAVEQRVLALVETEYPDVAEALAKHAPAQE